MSWPSKSLQFISNRPFGTATAIYFLAALGCAPCLPYWSADHDYIATRALIGNHRIVMSDIKRPVGGFVAPYGFYLDSPDSLLGKYVPLGQRIEAGKPINTEELVVVSLGMV